jgi:uncharacterized protein YndB with AHSA1/START domain
MSQDAIVIDVALDAPPGLVWRALTEPALVARWLGANDVEARIGRRFTVEPTAGEPPVDCEVIEVEPDRRLSYRWRDGGEGAAALDTVVTWVLDPTPDGGTRLRLVHDGFPIILQQPAAATHLRMASGAQHACIAGIPSPLAGEGGPRRGSDEGSRRPLRLAPTSERRLAWAA